MRAETKKSRTPETDNYIFQYYDAIRRIKRGEKVGGVRAAGEYIHDIFRILTDGIRSGEYFFDKKKRIGRYGSLKIFVIIQRDARIC